MRDYLEIGIWALVNLIPWAFLIFLCFIIIELFLKFIMKKKIEFKILYLACQFLWILLVLTILRITGILGGNFGISSPLDSFISYKLFEEGLNVATLLNICLFIPYGFLSVLTFKNIAKHWWLGILIGLIFSASIEYLQTFTGRFAQLDDIVMNTLGTFIGYEICIGFVRIYKNRFNKGK